MPPRARATAESKLKSLLYRRMQVCKLGHLPYFNPYGGSFVNGRGKRIKGLTELLKQRFYPDYRLPSGNGLGAGGRRGGSLVHAELAMALVENRPSTNELAERVRLFFRDHGFRVKQVELAVAYKKIATALDFLMLGPDDELYGFELKTGMNHAFTGHIATSQQRLAAPLQRFSSCPGNHAILQAAACKFMLKHTYGWDAKAMVVQVDSNGVRCFAAAEHEPAYDAAVQEWLRSL